MLPEQKNVGTGQSLISSLYRSEFARMVALLGRRFGLTHIELAEDIVAETFLVAAENWVVKGVPPNPVAWLYTVAKRKMLQHLRRNRILNEKVLPTVAGLAKWHQTREPDLSPQYVRDSQLAMIFAVCDPAIASEAQIGLALRILCGFSIDEIAEAFFSNRETINKRLFRAKEKLRAAGIVAELPPLNEIPARLENVLRVVYLLFNEGYYSRTHDSILRHELCFEAMRLATLLAGHELTQRPAVYALLALMCFHASRFTAREQGELILYAEQNASLWDQDLIAQGMHFFDLSASGDALSSYHLEAGIAYWHSVQIDSAEKWQQILGLYDRLLATQYSPAAALNRVYVLYKVHGPEKALSSAQELDLTNSHFFHILLAELYKENNIPQALFHLRQARALAQTAAERRHIDQRLKALE